MGSPPGRPGREVPARAPPTSRPGGQKTWEDVAYPQLTGRFCAMMGRTGGGRAGDGTRQAGEPHAGRVGGQGQAHEAGRVPRPDGLRGAPGRGCRPWLSRRGRARGGAASSPGPPRRCPGCTSRGAGRTCPTLPTRTPATTRSRSATSWGAGTACPTPATRGLLPPPPGESNVEKALPGVVVARPGAAGPAVHGGSVADATTMEAPSPPENAPGSCSPGIHQTKKGIRGRTPAAATPAARPSRPQACPTSVRRTGSCGTTTSSATPTRPGGASPGARRSARTRTSPGPAGASRRTLRAWGRQARRARRGAEPRPPCARGQASLPDR